MANLLNDGAVRNFTTVQIRDANDEKLLAHFILYSYGGISASDINGGTSIPMTLERFHEWFSFALFQGNKVTVMLRDNDHHITQVVTF